MIQQIQVKKRGKINEGTKKKRLGSDEFYCMLIIMTLQILCICQKKCTKKVNFTIYPFFKHFKKKYRNWGIQLSMHRATSSMSSIKIGNVC